MKVTVSAGDFGGTIPAIASKSYAHRLLICAALSKKPCRIVCATASNDILATADCLRALGADIRQTADGFAVTPVCPNAIPQSTVLDCGESGSTLRFMLPVVCALGAKAEFIMHGRLAQRPLSPLYEELERHGVKMSPQGVSPLRVSGKLIGADFTIPADVSSQFISGLMLALPIMGGGIVTLTGKKESASYIDITAECMRKAGVSASLAVNTYTVGGEYKMPDIVSVEGDWSNAAFWLCAGAVGKKTVTVTGLNPASAQGDRKIVDIIKMYGASVMETKNGITVSPSILNAADVDAADIPDLIPIISVLAAKSQGKTVIRNAERLRLKESDRLKAICNIMSTLLVDIIETNDGLEINGGVIHGGTVDSWNDHRIAMTAAIAALAADTPVTIENAQCVNKSYPEFFEDFRKLGGRVYTEKE